MGNGSVFFSPRPQRRPDSHRKQRNQMMTSTLFLQHHRRHHFWLGLVYRRAQAWLSASGVSRRPFQICFASRESQLGFYETKSSPEGNNKRGSAPNFATEASHGSCCCRKRNGRWGRGSIHRWWCPQINYRNAIGIRWPVPYTWPSIMIHSWATPLTNSICEI